MINKIIELGYVVSDLDVAIAYFKKNFLIDNFAISENLQLNKARYLGSSVDVQIDITMGSSGGMVIELIQQQREGDSPFHRPKPGELFTFNHWSMFSENFDSAVENYMRLGWQEVFYAEVGGKRDDSARLIYLEDKANPVGYLEIMDASPPTLLNVYEEIINK